MTFRGADNTLSLPDHYNHIHVGFHPLFGENKKLGKQLAAILKPGQWIKLIDRLNSIPNPKVSPKPLAAPSRLPVGSFFSAIGIVSIRAWVAGPVHL